MNRMLTADEAKELRALLEGAQRVVAMCHVNPDGDAIGSVCVAVSLLRRMGKEAVGIVPNSFPDNLRAVAGSTELLVCNTNRECAKQAVEEADLILCMDYNEPSRVGALLAGYVSGSRARRVMMDHHLYPADFCDLTISHSEMCSTCEVFLRAIVDLGWTELLTQQEAEALYVGMMTDTGAFSYASNRPEVFECISLLLQKGVDKDKLYSDIYQSCTEGRLRLMGYLLYVKMEVMRERHTALLTMTNEEYRRFAVKNGDTEGFVNIPLQMDGIKFSIFLRQDTEEPKKIRVSTRSLGDFPCNKVAEEFFNGGGHRNAAGGSLMCSMDEATEVAHRAIEKYETLLNKQ